MILRLLTLTVGACLLHGCTVFDTAPSTAVTTVLPELSAEETAAVPAGARVQIERRFTNPEARASTTGVVLKAGPEGLALANCVLVGHSITGTPILNKVPYVSRLFKSTGIGRTTYPVLWVPRSEISAVHVVEPPPADYIPPAIEIETADPIPVGIDVDCESETKAVAPPN